MAHVRLGSRAVFVLVLMVLAGGSYKYMPGAFNKSSFDHIRHCIVTVFVVAGDHARASTVATLVRVVSSAHEVDRSGFARLVFF